MNLVEYRRVSSQGQADYGNGLVTQRKADRAWARDNGHRIVKVCTDEGVSGTTPVTDRPGFICVMDTLAAGVADGVLIPRLDRLARSVTIQEAALAALWASGFRVFAADQGEILADDVDDPMRTAMREMAGVVAGLDRRMVVKRLRDGRRAKAAAGRKATGAYAYGYAGAGKGRDRDAAPREDEQAAVRRIVELRQAGQSYRQIVAALEDEGFAPRKAAHWSPMTVRAIVIREDQS
jgi:DNA invertase Pin-like site-specific DNA recombinase